MNEELIKRCAEEAGMGEGAANAIRLYHARAVAPLAEAAQALLDRYVHAIGNEGIECLKLRTALAPFQQESADA